MAYSDQHNSRRYSGSSSSLAAPTFDSPNPQSHRNSGQPPPEYRNDSHRRSSSRSQSSGPTYRPLRNSVNRHHNNNNSSNGSNTTGISPNNSSGESSGDAAPNVRVSYDASSVPTRKYNNGGGGPPLTHKAPSRKPPGYYRESSSSSSSPSSTSLPLSYTHRHQHGSYIPSALPLDGPPSLKRPRVDFPVQQGSGPILYDPNDIPPPPPPGHDSRQYNNYYYNGNVYNNGYDLDDYGQIMVGPLPPPPPPPPHRQYTNTHRHVYSNSFPSNTYPVSSSPPPAIIAPASGGYYNSGNTRYGNGDNRNGYPPQGPSVNNGYRGSEREYNDKERGLFRDTYGATNNSSNHSLASREPGNGNSRTSPNGSEKASLTSFFASVAKQRIYSDFRIARVKIGSLEIIEDFMSEPPVPGVKDSRLRLYFRGSASDTTKYLNATAAAAQNNTDSSSVRDRAIAEPDRLSISIFHGTKRIVIPVQDGLDKVQFRRKDGYFRIKSRAWALFEELDTTNRRSNGNRGSGSSSHFSGNFRRCGDLTDGQLEAAKGLIEVWTDLKHPLPIEPKWTRGNLTDYIDSRSKYISHNVLQVLDPEHIVDFDSLVDLWIRDSAISSPLERESFVKNHLAKVPVLLELSSKVLAPPYYYVSKALAATSNNPSSIRPPMLSSGLSETGNGNVSQLTPQTAASIIESGQIPALISPAVNALLATTVLLSQLQISNPVSSLSTEPPVNEEQFVSLLKRVMFQVPEPILWRSLDGLFARRHDVQQLHFDADRVLKAADERTKQKRAQIEAAEEAAKKLKKSGLLPDPKTSVMEVQALQASHYGDHSKNRFSRAQQSRRSNPSRSTSQARQPHPQAAAKGKHYKNSSTIRPGPSSTNTNLLDADPFQSRVESGSTTIGNSGSTTNAEGSSSNDDNSQSGSESLSVGEDCIKNSKYDYSLSKSNVMKIDSSLNSLAKQQQKIQNKKHNDGGSTSSSSNSRSPPGNRNKGRSSGQRTQRGGGNTDQSFSNYTTKNSPPSRRRESQSQSKNYNNNISSTSGRKPNVKKADDAVIPLQKTSSSKATAPTAPTAPTAHTGSIALGIDKLGELSTSSTNSSRSSILMESDSLVLSRTNSGSREGDEEDDIIDEEDEDDDDDGISGEDAVDEKTSSASAKARAGRSNGKVKVKAKVTDQDGETTTATATAAISNEEDGNDNDNDNDNDDSKQESNTNTIVKPDTQSSSNDGNAIQKIKNPGSDCQEESVESSASAVGSRCKSSSSKSSAKNGKISASTAASASSKSKHKKRKNKKNVNNDLSDDSNIHTDQSDESNLALAGKKEDSLDLRMDSSDTGGDTSDSSNVNMVNADASASDNGSDFGSLGHGGSAPESRKTVDYDEKFLGNELTENLDEYQSEVEGAFI